MANEKNEQEVVRDFIKSLTETSTNSKTSSDELIKVIRDCLVFILVQLEKISVHLLRNSVVNHDPVLYKDIAHLILNVETVFENHFNEYLEQGELEQDEQE